MPKDTVIKIQKKQSEEKLVSLQFPHNMKRKTKTKNTSPKQILYQFTDTNVLIFGQRQKKMLILCCALLFYLQVFLYMHLPVVYPGW